LVSKLARRGFTPTFLDARADGPSIAIADRVTTGVTTKISSTEQAMDALLRVRRSSIPVRARLGYPGGYLFLDGYLAEPQCHGLEVAGTFAWLIFGSLSDCEYSGELREDADGCVSLDLSVRRGEICLVIAAETQATIWNCRWIQ
jgi:hypothetical protein